MGDKQVQIVNDLANDKPLDRGQREILRNMRKTMSKEEMFTKMWQEKRNVWERMGKTEAEITAKYEKTQGEIARIYDEWDSLDQFTKWAMSLTPEEKIREDAYKERAMKQT